MQLRSLGAAVEVTRFTVAWLNFSPYSSSKNVELTLIGKQVA